MHKLLRYFRLAYWRNRKASRILAHAKAYQWGTNRHVNADAILILTALLIKLELERFDIEEGTWTSRA